MRSTLGRLDLLAVVVSSTGAADLQGRIQVNVMGLRSDQGQVLCALHSNAAAFPMKDQEAVQRVRAPIQDKRAVCVFADVSPGRYAVAVTHDANANGVLDKKMFGIPAEGVGASNDARGRMGPPKFDDAAFEFDGGALSIEITVQYL